MADGEGIFYLMIGGPVLLSWGLRTWHKKRLIENTPCSKVRSAAMGLVELTGNARPRLPVKAPISGRECCWWRCQVQEYRRDNKRSRWVTIGEASSPQPFFLQDNTGRVLVDPQGAELHIPANTLPIQGAHRAAAEQLLAQAGVSATTWFGLSRQLRVLEQLVMELAPLYVLGELTRRVDHLQGRRERLAAKIRAAKQDPVQMSQADANRDGTVDADEWDRLRIALEQRFLDEEHRREAAEPADEKLIVRAPAQGCFILSTKPEKSLLGAFAWLAPGAALAGIALSGVGVWWALAEHWNPGLAVGLVGIGLVIGYFMKPKGAKKWVWS